LYGFSGDWALYALKEVYNGETSADTIFFSSNAYYKCKDLREFAAF
jgi:hypothetical protein